jgi:hypothetical protein
VVVGFAAAVFALPVAVAQDAQLAVPPALEQELVPGVPQAALLVAQDALLGVPPALERELVPGVPQAALLVAQDALPVRNAALVAHSAEWPDDQPGARWAPAGCLVVHLDA